MLKHIQMELQNINCQCGLLFNRLSPFKRHITTCNLSKMNKNQKIISPANIKSKLISTKKNLNETVINEFSLFLENEGFNQIKHFE